MERRRFLLTSLAAAVAAPLAVEGQQAGKVWRIGYLTSGFKDAPTPGITQFTRGLRDCPRPHDTAVAAAAGGSGD